jgi:hypothetical protein
LEDDMRYGNCHEPEYQPTISTGQYTAGDCVGTIQGITVSQYGTSILKNIVVTDADNEKANLTFVFFKRSPAGTFTDNAAFPLSAADLLLVVGKVNILSTDYETIASRAIADVECSIVLKSEGSGSPPSSETIYVGILTTSTPTYTATSDLGVKLGLLMD